MPSLIPQMQRLINELKTQEALHLFAQTGQEVADLLQTNFDAALKNRALGKISNEAWQTTIQRIHFALSELCQSSEEIDLPTTLTFEAARFPIRQAIRQGNMAEVLNLLLRTGELKSALFLDKFTESGHQKAQGLIDPEEYDRAQVQLCANVLELDWMKKTDLLPKNDLPAKIILLEMLRQRQTEQVLARCADNGDAYVLLQLQLNLAKKHSSAGLMESEYWEATKSSINYILQELIAALPDEKPPKTSIFNKIRKLFTE